MKSRIVVVLFCLVFFAIACNKKKPVAKDEKPTTAKSETSDVQKECNQSRKEKIMYGAIDKYGKEIIPVIYDNDMHFYKGYATVEKDNKYGVIDSTGKIIIPVRYDDYYCLSFEGSLTCVKKK